MRPQRLFALIVLLAMFSLAAPAGAQGGSWSEPFEVSSMAQARTAWFPDLVVGPDGTIAVIWCSFPKLTDRHGSLISVDALFYRELKDGHWSEANDIFSFPHPASEPIEVTVRNSIVAGRDGKLHVLYRTATDVMYFNAPWQEAWSALAWSPGRSISPRGGYYNALAVDSRAGLHALWTEAVIDPPDQPRAGCPNCANLFYRSSPDGGANWTLPQNLSSAFEGANRPQIAIDQFDRIHVVWDEGFDWYAGNGEPKYGVYRRSDDGGATWGPPTVFNLGSMATYQTTLALMPEGNPVVVYRTARQLYFQSSEDGGNTWGPPNEIPGFEARSTSDPNLDRYSMAVDGAGRVHVLAVGFRTEHRGVSPALLHLVREGERWLEPVVIVENGLFPEWPRLGIAGGNQLHAVWFTRNSLYSENDTRQVWHSTLSVDAPAVTPLPLFTATPLPLPTAPPTTTPLPTVLPAPIARARVIDEPPAWERPAMLMIGAALLPAAALLGLVVVVARRRE